MREANAAPQLDEIVICAFGVIASPDIYPQRYLHISSSVNVQQGSLKIVSLTDASIPVDLTVNTYLRITGEDCDFVTISNESKQMKLRPTEETGVKEYSITLETVERDSENVLFTDEFRIIVESEPIIIKDSKVPYLEPLPPPQV